MLPALPKTPTPDVIYCIGDSHVSFFAGEDVIQPGWPERSTDRLPWFRTFHIGPALAYSLARPNTQTRGREKVFEILDQAVPAGARVLLCFGEIDCRAQVLKQAARHNLPLESIVANCLDAYFQVVGEVLARGFEVVVYNAVPSRLRTPRKIRPDDDFGAVGSWQERNAAIRCFNAGARQRSQACGVHFLETYPGLVNAKGRTVNWFYFDSIHVSQRALPLTLQALRNIFPGASYPQLPMPHPSGGEQLMDRVRKRVRRWLKLPPPATRHVYE